MGHVLAEGELQKTKKLLPTRQPPQHWQTGAGLSSPQKTMKDTTITNLKPILNNRGDGRIPVKQKNLNSRRFVEDAAITRLLL